MYRCTEGGRGGGKAGTGVCIWTVPHCLSRVVTQPKARLSSLEAEMATRKGTSLLNPDDLMEK